MQSVVPPFTQTNNTAIASESETDKGKKEVLAQHNEVRIKEFEEMDGKVTFNFRGQVDNTSQKHQDILQ